MNQSIIDVPVVAANYDFLNFLSDRIKPPLWPISNKN